jgi:hypothetical protein
VLAAALFGLGGLSSSCATTPPPLWATGGAALQLGRAVWVQADGEQLLLDEQGRVFADGKHIYSLDRAGRVVDDVNDPVALLDGEGQLYATNEAYWGRIGVQNAAPPWSPEAWLRITKHGTVVLFDQDGETVIAGRWTGCQGPLLRTCTLLTHISLLRAVNQRRVAYPYGANPYLGWGSPYWGSPFWGVGAGFYFY